MTKEIQEFLRDTIINSTGLREDLIHLTSIEDNTYNTPPWVSIMPDLATVDYAFHWDSGYVDDEGNAIKTKRKYTVTQPYSIHIRQVKQEDISANVHLFLEKLAWKTVIKNVIVEFLPPQFEFFMAQGDMDLYAAIITVNATYGIYQSKTITEKISEVQINTEL